TSSLHDALPICRTACEAPIVWTCLECRSPTTETTDRPPGRVWDRGGVDWGGGPGDRDRPARGGKAGRGENALQKSAATHRNTAALLKPLSRMRTEPGAGGGRPGGARQASGRGRRGERGRGGAKLRPRSPQRRIGTLRHF